jgi:hypothetical protein
MGAGTGRAVRAAAWLWVPLLAACAAAETVPGDGAGLAAPGATVFVVQNDHTSRRDMIIYLEPEGRGERRQLGRVETGATTTLTAEVERGYYRLIAAHDMGDFRSARFNVLAPSQVRWQMATGRITVSRL